MLCVSFVCFCVWPDMVLNQRQVLVVVSGWEPYLGSLFCHCGLWVIASCVSVCATRHCFVYILFVSLYCVMFSLFY
jgi:hypothetical protein